MSGSGLQELISVFESAFRKLGLHISAGKMHELAVVVHQAMTVQTRYFHTLEHVFTFVNPDNPIQSLAALYHDIVYYQVDMGFAPAIWAAISPYVREENGMLYLSPRVEVSNPGLDLPLQVFDFHPGQKLPPVGENEFLSAVVMNEQLAGLISEKHLLQLTLCIEATIPFRGKTPQGRNHFDVLEERLRTICAKRGIPISETEIEEAIKLAVKFANKDTENFGDPNPARFLSNTWKLLPEMNVALRARDVYTVSEYRKALQQMEGFMRNLRPEVVFAQYRGEPPPEEFDQLSRRARRNIAVASQYLQVKLLAAMILDALAIVTATQAPYSLLMEDTIGAPVSSDQPCEDFLPELPIPEWLEPSSDVYQLMQYGSGLEMKSSPMGLFLLKKIPPGKMMTLINHGKDALEGRGDMQAFLALIDFSILEAIAQACESARTPWGDVLKQYLRQHLPPSDEHRRGET